MTARLSFVAGLACLVPVAAAAGEVTHRLGKETLEDVARNYYGKAWKAVYLRTRNGIADDAKLPAGKRIVIPASWTYRIKRGDTASLIAKRYLNNPNRYSAILAFNGIKNAGDLDVGEEILMPFHLFHIVQPGGSLSQISRRYYRTTRWASVLKEYNGVGVLKPNQKIVVPIFDKSTVDARSRRYVAKKTKDGATAPARSPPASAEEVQQRLQAGINGYYAGEFEDACEDLDLLLDHVPSDNKDFVQLIQHLAFCAVAFGDEAAARDYFRKWIEIDPSASLNPITTSPKILAVFHDVASDAEGGSP